MCDKLMNKSIFIGYDRADNIISIIISDSRNKVDVVWTAQRNYPFRIEELPFIRLCDFDSNISINGTVFLLTSYKETINGKDCIIYKRGL